MSKKRNKWKEQQGLPPLHFSGTIIYANNAGFVGGGLATDRDYTPDTRPG
jgi:hypothetical protein